MECDGDDDDDDKKKQKKKITQHKTVSASKGGLRVTSAADQRNITTLFFYDWDTAWLWVKILTFFNFNI